MLIELWDFHSEFLGLIIPAKTGITYTNQVGGTACMHPEVEGFYIPLPHQWLTEEANEIVRDYAWRLPVAADLKGYCKNFLDADDGFLRSYFTEPNTGAELFAEAWIPVLVKKNECDLTTSQVAGHQGILTWSNSD